MIWKLLLLRSSCIIFYYLAFTLRIIFWFSRTRYSQTPTPCLRKGHQMGLLLYLTSTGFSIFAERSDSCVMVTLTIVVTCRY